MNRLVKMSIINKSYFLVMTFVIIFIVTLSLFITNDYFKREKDIRAKQIFNVAEQLDKNLNSSFEDILYREKALHKTSQEKVLIINNELQPIVDDFSDKFPNLGVGYYSIDLDSIVAIGPDFKLEYLKRVSRKYPYFRSYETGKPEYVNSGDSIGWQGKSIFAITYPIKRDGKIIGHTWANIKMDDLYNGIIAQTRKLFIFGALFLLLLLLFIKLVFTHLKKQIKEVTDNIINNRPYQRSILPELDKMAEKIKEQRKYEEEISKLDKLSSIGEMAATIAHEVRNPLTTIRGFLQLNKSSNLSEKELNYTQVMIEELDRANDIITEYLALAKSADSYYFEQENLNKIIESIFPLIQSSAIKENKTAILELGEIPNLQLNTREIKQLILNLCRNGIEAMNEIKSGNLKIKTTSYENKVIMEIADEGKGIPPEILEKIGEPFLTNKPGGNGLGLSVCFRIVEKHKATIEIETNSNGTKFLVEFT